MLTIRSLGGSLRLSGLTITGEGEQALDFDITGGDCGGGIELDNSETCTVQVTFTPSHEGPRKAALQISWEPNRSRTVLLRGNVGPPLGQGAPTITQEDEVLKPGQGAETDTEEDEQPNPGAPTITRE
jgi:hypothetical protein